MEHGGISQRLVRFAKNLVGHIKGGLGIVVVVSEVFFSGISGSSIADASAIGSLLLPSMVRAGYTPPRASSIIAAATGMGILIPPCLNMVVLGAMANISIAGLFMGGFLPGFLMAMTLMVIIYYQSSKGILPGPGSKEGRFREVLASFKESIIPLMMPRHHLWRDLRWDLHRHGGRLGRHGLCLHRLCLCLQGSQRERIFTGLSLKQP